MEKAGIKDKINLKMEADQVVIFKVEGVRIGGVYAESGGNRAGMKAWLTSFENKIERGMLIGDWNTLDGLWDERQDSKGTVL